MDAVHPGCYCIRIGSASKTWIARDPGADPIRSQLRRIPLDPSHPKPARIPRIQDRVRAGSGSRWIGFGRGLDRAPGSGSRRGWIGRDPGPGASKIWIGAVRIGCIQNLDRGRRIGCDPQPGSGHPDRARSTTGSGAIRIGTGRRAGARLGDLHWFQKVKSRSARRRPWWAAGGIWVWIATFWVGSDRDGIQRDPARIGIGSGSLLSGWRWIGARSKGIQPGSGSDRDRYFLDGLDRVGSGSGNPGSGAIPDR